MTINVVQAAILGLCACLSSMPGLGGTTFGNYTLGRPLIGGLVCGLVLGNVPMGIMLGAAVQIVYIALVTPGGTVSADVRSISYIGIPLAMLYVSSVGLDPAASHLMKGYLAELCQGGSAVFFSTHVLEVAEKRCDKIAIIKAGRLVKSGPTAELVGDSSLEDVFLELEGEK